MATTLATPSRHSRYPSTITQNPNGTYAINIVCEDCGEEITHSTKWGMFCRHNHGYISSLAGYLIIKWLFFPLILGPLLMLLTMEDVLEKRKEKRERRQ